eukprot:9805214-Alexandrium_andersonii.AAC.1
MNPPEPFCVVASAILGLTMGRRPFVSLSEGQRIKRTSQSNMQTGHNYLDNRQPTKDKELPSYPKYIHLIPQL